MASGADANDVDITNVNKLEGADASEYIDLGADLVEIVSNTIVSATAPNVKIAVDAAAYLNIATVNAGQTTISQVSDGAGVGTDAGIILGATGNSVVTRLEGGADAMCDGCYTGQVIEGIVAGEDVAQGTAVFLASDGKWDSADADAAGEFPAWGVAVECKGGPDWPCQVDEALTVLVKGVYRDDDFTQFDVVGDVLYLGDGVAVTTSLYDESAVPATSNDCVQVMGMVIDEDTIYVNVSPDWFLVE